MDNNGQTHAMQADEIEIDLLDIGRRLLVQWRLVLVVALICGSLAVLIGFASVQRRAQKAAQEETTVLADVNDAAEDKAKSAANAQTTNEAQSSANAQTESETNAPANAQTTNEAASPANDGTENARDASEDEEEFPASDAAMVETVISKQRRVNQAIQAREDSVSYSIDPYHRKTLSIRYYISDANPTVLPAIKDYYMTYAGGQTMIEALAARFPDAAETEIRSALGASVGTMDSYADGVDGFFSVSYNLIPENMDVDEIIQTMDGVLRDVTTEVAAQIGQHRLNELYVDRYTYIDTGLRDAQTALDNEVYSAQSDLAVAVSTFTDMQFAYFLERLREERIDTSYTANDIGVANRASKDEENADAEPETEESDDEDEPDDAVNVPKWFALGMLCGIFLCAAGAVLPLILGGVIGSPGSIVDASGVRELGTLRRYAGATRWERFRYDRRVFQTLYRASLSDPARERALTELLASYTKHHDTGDLRFVALAPLTTFERSLCQTLTAALCLPSGEASVVDFSQMDASAAEERFYEFGDAIVLVSLGRSTYRRLGELFAVCDRHRVQIHGAIFTEG